MAATASSPVVLLVIACCWSFVSSGILPGPVRGYETYQHTFSSQQSQSDDSRTGAFQSYTVTSRQCSIIHRVTKYETVRIPFLCQGVTGRVAPLPSHVGSNSVQVLNAMQAGGWSMCYQPITAPLYRYQRIPVCCPGTTPTPHGGCLCKKEGSTVVLPTPGQLLQSNSHIFTDMQDSSIPDYNYLPASSTPIRVQPPRPYRGILSKVPPGSVEPNSLLHQVTLSGAQGGPTYSVDNEGSPNTYFPRHPMAPGGGVTEWQGDIARYLATMMYQTLLVEQQQHQLQDEIGRQLRLKQQMDFLFALQQQKQRQQQQQQQNPWGGSQQQPTFSSNPPPSPQPNPIPSPPIEVDPMMAEDEQSTTVAPDMDLTQGVPDAHQPGAVGEGAVEEGEGPKWNREGGGILHDMEQQQDSTGSSTPMFGNGPRNIPPGAGRSVETKEKVKGIIDSCLKASGFPSMEMLLESGDIDQLRPVCRSTQTVGPCVLRAAEDAFGQNQLGMVGRHMMRSVLMSLGQLCQKLDQMDSTSPVFPNPPPPVTDSEMDSTSPVFPNPPPPVTDSVVTRVTGHIISGDNPPATDTTASNDNQSEDIIVADDSPVMESRPPASAPQDLPPEDTMTAGSDSPLDMPAVTPSPAQAHAHIHAHIHAKKTIKDSDSFLSRAASFPLWLILAMVGGCAALLLLICLAVCLVLRCRRKNKSLELEREPEKLPVPPTESNIYLASPCHPPPSYPTTPVKQTMGGEEEGMEEEFKIPEDSAAADQEDADAGKAVEPLEEKALPEEEEGKEAV